MATDLDPEALLDALISHQMASGFFEIVAQHEPKAAPGDGITAASWFQNMRVAPRVSGQAVLSLRIEFMTRLYHNMLAPDEDAIDPRMLRAAGHLFKLYAGDFTLGGSVMHVDFHAAHGAALEAKASYVRIGQNHMYRIYDVVTPLILADVWDLNA